MNNVRVVVQVRSDSSRFPCKAFVPIAGVPSAALVGLRARNRGADVVMATTTRSTDDALAFMLRAHGLAVARGPTDDVRGRFLHVTRDLDDDDIVVRITADNVVPDGDFIERLVTEFRREKATYMGTTSAARMMPLGLGAEAFRLGALRSIAAEVDDPYDREHVTPMLRQRYASGGLDVTLGALPKAGHLRCTLDTVADYERLVQLFTATDQPVTVTWRTLLERLVALEQIAAVKPEW